MTAPKRHTRPPASDKPEHNPVNRKGQGRDEWFAARLHLALDGRAQTWLAEKTGLSTSTINDYAKGAIPSADRAFLIARVLGVDAEWLITGKDDTGRNLEVDELWTITRIPHADLMRGLDAPMRTRIAKATRTLEYILLDLTGQDFRFLFMTPMPPGGFHGIAEEGTPILCARATELVTGAHYLVRVECQIEVRQAIRRDKELLLVPGLDHVRPISAPPLVRQTEPPLIVARVLGTAARLLIPDKTGSPVALV